MVWGEPERGCAQNGVGNYVMVRHDSVSSVSIAFTLYPATLSSSVSIASVSLLLALSLASLAARSLAAL